MSESPSDPGAPIDDLVAAHLRRIELQTDARALLDRIEADRRLDLTAPPVAAHHAGPRMFAWAVMAAAVVVAFLGGRFFDSSPAHAASLLRTVRTVHTQSVDRCYRVQHALEPSGDADTTASASESILWTRGDQFWSDAALGSRRIRIGRDETGTVWLAPNPQKGIRFSPDRASFPEEIETLCQIASLTVPVLVDDVLEGFDLKTDRPTPHSDGLRSVIWARLKDGRTHPFLSAAMLEVDVERNLVVRLVLWLHAARGPNGTVTYTLIDRPAPPAESYRLEHHLDAEAVIEDQTFPRKL